jgi:hypothetical protein
MATAPTSASKSIADRIAKPSGQMGYVGATIFGKGGVGKTTLLGTMPGMGVVIDIPQVEGGTCVLVDQVDHVRVLPVTTWDDLDAAHKYLRDEKHGFKWYAIDTVTATQELAKRKTLKERDLSGDPRIIDRQDWGKIGELQKSLFYSFRSLPMHGIFLAQEKLREGGEGGALEYQPDVSPASLSGLVPSMFLIGRMFTREIEDPKAKELVIERRLRVGTQTLSVAKVRALPTRQLPPVLKNPHLGRIFAWLLGSPKATCPEAAGADPDLFAGG